jgi:hypothetical protein
MRFDPNEVLIVLSTTVSSSLFVQGVFPCKALKA